jgi:hypothetical protein
MALRPESNELILEIRGHLSRALRALFERAIKDGSEDDPICVLDDKAGGLPKRGPLQDCEFGWILFHCWTRLNRQRKPEGIVADDAEREEILTDATVDQVLLQLVLSTVCRVCKPTTQDLGGEDPDSRLFFTGEPYTQSRHGNQPTFSANLDSAMIMVAFLAPVMVRLDSALTTVDPPSGGPSWVKSMRDAALYVSHGAVQYALKCRIFKGDKFQGFSPDPKTAKTLSDNPRIVPKADRLFFTWTACETIRDLLELAADLERIANAPQQQLQQFLDDIKELSSSLLASANWSQEEDFLEQFFHVKPHKDVALVVTSIGKLEPAKLSQEEDASVAALGSYVQQVYQLAQYAAIRSLAPSVLQLEDVQKICKRLHALVHRDIIVSGLDASEHPVLARTLTRMYSLGEAAKIPYSDDAYYPLVVRSLSGLLSRTLTHLADKTGWPEALRLAREFRLVLEDHYYNLVRRRPKADKDKHLWSYAPGQEYVLYATQRTMFALLCYLEFLNSLDIVSAPKKIFICYRRDQSANVADEIARHLMAHFGQEAVFIDYDSITAGQDFEEILEHELQKCSCLLAVIGKGWLNTSKKGKRRLEDEKDFVRIEIATALEKDIPVIPVLVDQARIPPERRLPKVLKPLAKQQACPVRPGKDKVKHLEDLRNAITRHMKEP